MSCKILYSQTCYKWPQKTELQSFLYYILICIKQSSVFIKKLSSAYLFTIDFFLYMWHHLRKSALWRDKYWKALTQRRAYYAMSGQGLRYISLMSIYWTHFCHSLCSINHTNYLKHVKTADLGWKYLFFNNAPFCRWCYI